MSEWSLKRFWSEVSTRPTDVGFEILLDGRPVRTPSKAPLALPTDALAQEVAAEWAAQDDMVRPDTMPFTRTANSAIDTVAVAFDDVAEIVAAYGGSDLLCYRADSPAELVTRQADCWDPLLRWADEAFAAPLIVTTGVMPVTQGDESLENLSTAVRRFNPFGLAGLHELVTLSGSLVIGLAVAYEYDAPDTLWQASRLDELWQIEQWGADEEAEAVNSRRRQAFLEAARFASLSRGVPALPN